MICQVCKKHSATTHLKRIINGKAFEVYVCDQCALQHGSGMLNISPFSIDTLFGGLFSEPVWHENNATSRCSTCSKTFQDIINSGRVGCADCYSLFYERLLPSIQRIHGKTTHIGKSSDSSFSKIEVTEKTPRETVEQLKQELETAIKAQEYERCVELRDRIKQLEGDEESE